jgi:hypothetical protein
VKWEGTSSSAVTALCSGSLHLGPRRGWPRVAAAAGDCRGSHSVKWGRRAVSPVTPFRRSTGRRPSQRVAACAANDEWGNGRRWWIVPRRPCGEGKRERTTG